MAIQFLNTVQVDTSVLYVDTVNDRVGVGTTSPNEKLDVNGITISKGFRTDVTNTDYNLLSRNSSGNATLYVQSATSNTNQPIAQFNYGSAAAGGGQKVLLVAKDNSYFVNTNVGIGTTSPGAKLDVKDGNSAMRFQEYSNGASLFLDGSNGDFIGGDYFNISAYGATDLAFGYGAVTKMVMKSTGNVGIGTTSPDAKLDIEGDFEAGYALKFTNTKGTGTVSGFRSHGANGEDLSLYNGANLIQRWDENGNSVFDGSVGIGTSNPSTNLQVIGTVRADVFGVQDDSTNPSGNTSTRVTSPAGATYDDQSNSASTGVLSVILPTTATSTMLSFTLRVFDYANNESFDVNVAGYWYSSGLWTNTSVRIESQGDVERNFNVRFGKNNNNNKGWVGVGETTTNWSYVKFAVLNFQAAHVNDDLERWNDLWDTAVLTSLTDYTTLVTKNNNQVNNWARNGEDLYYGSGTGNVGIGPTSPVTKLHLYDNAGTVGLSIQADNASNSDINLGDEDDIDIGRIQYSHSTDSMILQTNNAERMRINSSGVIQFNNYNSTNNTGTPTYLLGTDASGNIVKTNTIPGSGVGPYLPLSAGSSYPLTGTLYGTSTNFSGSGDYAGNMTLGTGASTAEAHLQIGAGRTGNGYSYIDLIGDATYSDYGLRIIRNNTGANTSSAIIHRGTGNLEIATVESSSVLFKTGNSEKMRILANGNVGIGTTSPSSPLTFGKSVYGDFNSENFYRIKLQDQGGTHNDVGIGQTASGSMGFNITSGSAFIFNNGTSGEIARFNGTGLGIGTTSPQEELHIASTVPVVRIEDTDGGYAQIVGSDGSLSLRADQANTVASSIIDFTIDNSEKMRILANGNVGIGTTSPSRKLEVDFTGSVYGAKFTRSDAAGSSLIEFANSAGVKSIIGYDTGVDGYKIGTASATNLVVKQSGNVGIGVTNPSTKLHVGGIAQIVESGNTAFYGGNYVRMFGDQNYGFRNTGGTYIANISMSGNSYFNGGNVGIGTTSPAYKLDVNGTGRINGITFLASGATRSISTHSGAGQLQLNGGTSSANGAHINIAADSYGSGDFVEVHAARTYLSGNVGIGTTSPNSKLQVDGEIDANGGGGYKINGKPWANESSNNLKLGDWDGEAFTTSIFDENSAEIVTIGNYGTMINCSSLTSTYGATATLAVGTAGATSSGAAVITLNNNDTTSSAGDATGIIQFAIKGDGSTLGYTSASIRGSISQAAGSGNGGGGILDFYTAPASAGSSPQTRMRINQNGNIGIGTTSPSEKLEVNGSVKATASTDAYKGYIKQTITSSANEKVDNADYNLIPYNTLTTTSSDQSYNRMVAAYDGRIKKVYIKNTGGNTPTSDTVNFKKQVNNTTSSTVYSATVANAGSAGMSAVYNFADNDFTFSEGDTFGILYQTVNTGGGGRSMGGVAINIIIEYNIT